jgi:predicted nicotinamide N-methyase
LDEPGVRPVLIKEAHNLLSRGNNVGLRTWEGALHLAWYLVTQRPELVRGKNVLELGAGTGILSLLCAGHLRASSVLATDGLGHVCEGLQANIDLNVENNTLQDGRPPSVLQLDWTDQEAIDELVENVKTSATSYDLIIGSDITYHPDILRPLAQILSTLKDCSPNVVILISAAIRSDTFSQFTTICRAEFGFSVVEEQVNIPDGLQHSGFFHSVITPIKVVSLQRGTVEPIHDDLSHSGGPGAN